MCSTLVIGDLHLSLQFGNFDKSEDIYDKVIFILNKHIHQYNRVIFLGDVFNMPNPSPFHLRYFANILSFLYSNDKQVRIILGNHDVARYNNHHSLMVFEKLFENTIIYSKAGKEVVGDYNYVYLPYYYDKEDINLIDDKTILFSHRDTQFDIDDSITETDYILNFNGHIHSFKETEDFINVSSVTKYNMSEKRDIKRYILLNGDEYKVYKFESEKMYDIIINYSKKKLSIDNKNYKIGSLKHSKIDFICGAYVDLTINTQKESDINDDKLSSLLNFIEDNCYIRKRDFLSQDKYFTFKTLENVSTPEKMIKEYIDRFYNGDDKNEVFKLSKELLKECI